MLELALKDSTYPTNILISCLGDVVSDAPKGKHRKLWQKAVEGLFTTYNI